MIFPKCGEKAVYGLIPGYNFVIWAKIVGRKPLHALWLLVPIVSFFIYFGLVIDLARSFNRLTFLDSTLAVLFAPIYFMFLAKSEQEQYVGPTVILEREYKEKIQQVEKEKNEYQLKKLHAKNPYKKSSGREWAEAAVFSIFVAAFIRMFMVEAFTIPTSSMEGSLLVGDYLFVSKMSYGVRMPQTVIQVPLLHNRIPFINRESYLKNPQLPYRRFFQRNEVQAGDLVVFNWPAGDSIYLTPTRSWSVDQVRRMPSEHQANFRGQKIISRPMDKTDFYIKRCVAGPGSIFELRDGNVFIDGEPFDEPKDIQFRYEVISNAPISTNTFNRLDINILSDYIPRKKAFHLNQKQVEGLRTLDDGIMVNRLRPTPESPYHLFPHDPENFPGFTWDDYGPIPIPGRGETVQIDHSNIALYRRIINVYEDNDLDVRADGIYINGELATEYTFQQNYYWMVGDNRHNSEDSRVWGYVPEDHVVGKPLFIFFSTRNANMRDGIRWNRVFKSAKGI